MSENETLASNHEAPKSRRTMILVVIGVAVGLVILVALNMN